MPIKIFFVKTHTFTEKITKKITTSLISIFRSHKFVWYIYGNNMEYQITALNQVGLWIPHKPTQKIDARLGCKFLTSHFTRKVSIFPLLDRTKNFCIFSIFTNFFFSRRFPLFYKFLHFTNICMLMIISPF